MLNFLKNFSIPVFVRKWVLAFIQVIIKVTIGSFIIVTVGDFSPTIRFWLYHVICIAKIVLAIWDFIFYILFF